MTLRAITTTCALMLLASACAASSPAVSNVYGPPGLGTNGPETPRDSEGTSLDKEQIRAVIHAHRESVRACYESLLGRNTQAVGKIRVQFIVSKDGHVEEASAVESSLGDSEFQSCVAFVVLQMKFPSAGKITSVTYPFIFKQADAQRTE